MPIAHVLIAVLVTAIWGLNFVVIKWGLEEFSPLLFCTLRFLVAATPVLILRKSPTAEWKWVASYSFIWAIVQFGLVFLAMANGMTAGLSSVILQSQAFFTALLAAMLLRERPTGPQILGGLFSMVGLFLIASQREGSSFGVLLLVIGAIAWSIANLIVKKAKPKDVVAFTAWSSALSVLPLAAICWSFESHQNILHSLAHFTSRGIGVLLYMGLLSTLAAYAMWTWLMRNHSATVVAPFSLLVPVFGMGFSMLLLGELFSFWEWFGSILIVGALAISLIPANFHKLTTR